ncbi:MAG: cobalt-precorrin-6A reductase [Rhodospirillales bacterium]|nr:MAG: cobalt-precorrin-6A reductase [Rhodospirillales bacterium]
MKRLLILGGTGEAVELANAVARRCGDRIRILSSLAGRTRKPRPMAGELRVGGFGGATGLAGYLREMRIDFVIDATHPFAARISANARRACDAAGVPRLMLVRPPWVSRAKDRWIVVPDTAAAVRRLPRLGRRAFVALGSGGRAAFDGLKDVVLIFRVAEARDPLPLPGREVIVARGPFRMADEVRLLNQWRVDVVVSRNSGGAATYAKIAAARELAIPVIMIERPPSEPGCGATNVEEAVEWILRELD